MVHVLLRCVILGDAGESEDDDAGVVAPDRACLLTPRDVSLELLADGHGELVVVHDGQFVAFERGMDEEARKFRFIAVEGDDFRDDKAEEAFVVVGIHEDLRFSEPVFGAGHGAFVVENGLVKILLGREMAKNHGLGSRLRRRRFPSSWSRRSLCGRRDRWPLR